MATIGKIPKLGFGAGAIAYVALLGFTPNPVSAATAIADLVCAIPSDDPVCLLGSDDLVVAMPSDDGGVTA